MTTRSYTPESEPPEALVGFMREKYGEEENLDFFVSEFRRAFRFASSNPRVRFTPFVLEDAGALAGHAALIEDARLPAGEAFFGFFDGNSTAELGALWRTLVREAKERGVRVLKGPVNGSVWHQYRAVSETDGSPFFASELMSGPGVYAFLKEQSPAAEVRYYSAYRERFDAILKAGKEPYARMGDAGFSIVKTERPTVELLLTLLGISRAAFRENWGYVDLADKEFLSLYALDKLDARLGDLYLLRKEEAVIGFCATLRERDPRVVIAKTVAILPEYQGKGLGNALAYAVHADAQAANARRIIYALIREGNAIGRYPTEDAVIFRRYSAFEYALSA
ncbi:MAG: GNAT family N-acetyltransferase [Patescibacteria group bacterium]